MGSDSEPSSGAEEEEEASASDASSDAQEDRKGRDNKKAKRGGKKDREDKRSSKKAAGARERQKKTRRRSKRRQSSSDSEAAASGDSGSSSAEPEEAKAAAERAVQEARTKANADVAAAVREAEEMVERGREELFRREAENEERASLRRWLDEIQVRLAGQQETLRQNLQVRLHGQHGQRCAAETGRVAEELVQELAGLRGSAGLPLAEWRPRVEGFAQRAEATIAEAEGAVTEFQKARQDEFHKRLSAFQGAGQPRAEDAGPEDFIRSRGLSLHEGDLLEMAALMRRLKESGIQRSAAKQCLDHLFRSTWGAPTGAATPR
mmetsp:Transcript_106148/g.288034  ORF Transcript_106148/g.288034 Transcript_106148/m.288034 type:complete len:321 (-) Transcript_106148:245-1207(-)